MEDSARVIPPPPPAVRICNALLRGLYSRTLEPYELVMQSEPQKSRIELRFFIPRHILQLDITMPPALAARFKRVEFIPAEGDSQSIAHAVTHWKEAGLRTTVNAPRAGPIRQALVHFEAQTDLDGCSIDVRATKSLPRDLKLLREGFTALEGEFFEQARSALLAYQTSFTENPWVLLGLSRCHAAVGEFEEAERYCLQAMVRGLSGPAQQDYHALVDSRWFTPPARRKALLEGCRQWSLDEQHGLVSLERVQDHRLDLDTWRLVRDRELLLVRRAVAARMLSRVAFDFSDQDYLLYTGCRIVRRDGRIDTLPDERFVVGDSSSRDVSVVTRSTHTGYWLLPELNEGDQIEWTHHMLARQWIEDNEVRQYRAVVSDLCHHMVPTYRGIIRIEGHRATPLQVRVRGRGAHVAREERVRDHLRSTTLTTRRRIPVNNTNFEFERFAFNPLAAFTVAEHDWREDAKRSFRHNFGDNRLADSLPAALRRHFVPDATAEERLRRVFYWIRDRLKYAATGSAQELIGKEGRARAIIRAGVADCKDRAYLLALACRELELPAQMVAVSAARGVLIRDLPGEQCDHVFVKVRLPDRWVYLDATDPSTTFGTIPPGLQGMDCLILGENPSTETLPVDQPGANRLHVTECFDEIEDGWLSGSFRLEARGRIARMMDEHWKAQTLAARGLVPSAQAELRQYLPNIVLRSFERLSHTAESDRFAVEGHHHRCPLADIDRGRIGVLTWHTPFVPIDSWRTVNRDQVFVFPLPLTLRFGMRLTGRAAQRLDDVSRLATVENELCRVTETRTRANGQLDIERLVTINKRFVEPAELGLVAPSLETIEKAWRLTLAFRGPQDGDAASPAWAGSSRSPQDQD